MPDITPLEIVVRDEQTGAIRRLKPGHPCGSFVLDAGHGRLEVDDPDDFDAVFPAELSRQGRRVYAYDPTSESYRLASVVMIKEPT